ncbi:acyltransferase family protein [Cellulomonas alba]|uniref:Acyltransferase family protein n=1 Tax=Cellulomonas alba TaxID=3053467 RepID=A0ABT7SD12_9CELL|nr:acyltransferase family protein [Cellulomonas alba]MDM7854026.1 acyltransferase family protein [Cellulomonas alba]
MTAPVLVEREAAPPTGRPRSRTRPEIQALRALAVMLVVLYHLWPTRLTGGYVGVDVFFVISGFLITGHLLREATTSGRVHLAQFWARRARRLLPASLLVLGLTAVATLVWVPRALWHGFLVDTAAAATYVVNWALAAQSVDYLAADAAASPVQHYWSLSVEEQFYLVWPLLVGLAIWWSVRRPARRLVAVGAVLTLTTVASLVWSLHLTGASPSTAYFATTTRAWQFGAGGLLAVAELVLAGRATGRRVAPDARRDRLTAFACAGVLAVGVALIGWAALRFDGGTPFPGTAAIVPVVGAIAVIAAGAPSATRVGTGPLGLRPVQWLGDVSYSTYLWHWPPIILLPYALGRTLHTADKLVLLAVVLVLAGATKRWVEDPVRHASGPWRRPRVTFAWVVPAMAVVVAMSAWGVQQGDEAAHTAAQQVAAIEKAPPSCFGAASMDPALANCPDPALKDVIVPNPSTASGDFAGVSCWVRNDSAALESCSYPAKGATGRVPHVALVGDSHARAMLPALIVLANEGKLSLDTYLKGSCQWSTAVPAGDKATVDRCLEWRTKLHGRLTAHPGEYDAIVTAALSKEQFQVPAGQTREQYASRGLAAAWKPLAEAGVPIVYIRDNPIHTSDPNTCLQTKGKDAPQRCDITRKQAFATPDPQVAAAKLVGSDVSVIDLTSFYCTATTCPAVIGGVDVYRDPHHVTETYVRTLAPYLGKQLFADLARGRG